MHAEGGRGRRKHPPRRGAFSCIHQCSDVGFGEYRHACTPLPLAPRKPLATRTCYPAHTVDPLPAASSMLSTPDQPVCCTCCGARCGRGRRQCMHWLSPVMPWCAGRSCSGAFPGCSGGLRSRAPRDNGSRGGGAAAGGTRGGTAVLRSRRGGRLGGPTRCGRGPPRRRQAQPGPPLPSCRRPLHERREAAPASLKPPQAALVPCL